MTPEGKVKTRVKRILDSFGPIIWYFMPVSRGYGRHGIPDIIGCVNGHFFAIETKAGDKQPTDLQKRELRRIGEARGSSLVINEQNVDNLHEFLRGYCDETLPKK